MGPAPSGAGHSLQRRRTSVLLASRHGVRSDGAQGAGAAGPARVARAEGPAAEVAWLRVLQLAPAVRRATLAPAGRAPLCSPRSALHGAQRSGDIEKEKAVEKAGGSAATGLRSSGGA